MYKLSIIYSFSSVCVVNICPFLFFTYFSLVSRDNQTRQIQDAVSNVEKHFGELCQIFAGYVRKTARLRDKADLLVNEIYAYAATETPNLKVGLKNFADEFSRLQDYRQAEVQNWSCTCFVCHLNFAVTYLWLKGKRYTLQSGEKHKRHLNILVSKQDRVPKHSSFTLLITLVKTACG